MKNKILRSITVLFLATVFTNCGEVIQEYVYASSYVYVNGSSRDITVESYYYFGNGDFRKTPESTLVIPVGESHTLRFVTDAGFQKPFGWLDNPNPSDYVIVSNGEKQFKNTRSVTYGDDKLYRVESYEIIEENSKSRERVCRYVFTDKDFEHADPME